MVGHCAGKNQGFLLRDSGTAQVLSAYAEPEVRGRGVGRALLGACLQWASRQGCSRLLVEHETANISGSRFWQRHFDPYLCFSMRYVEDCEQAGRGDRVAPQRISGTPFAIISSSSRWQ
jgi:GNAT superfamily N-acetyltransferase